MAQSATPSIAPQLSAPWWVLYKQMCQTIGKTPGVVVKELEDKQQPMRLDIECADQKRAAALNRILVQMYPMGNVMVAVRVFCNGKPVPPDNQALPPANLIETLKNALNGNPFFANAIIAIHHPGPDPIGQVVAEFEGSVVQFWCDNLSDYYGNLNLVAADAFAKVLMDSYPGGTQLSFTTRKLTK